MSPFTKIEENDILNFKGRCAIDRMPHHWLTKGEDRLC